MKNNIGLPSQSDNDLIVDMGDTDMLPSTEFQAVDTTHNDAKRYITPPRYSRPPVAEPDVAYQLIETHQVFCKVPTVIKPPYNPEECTRIACISDTHGKHRHVRVPRCDVLIHGGDFTRSGEHSLIKDLDGYFHQLLRNKSVGEIICIAGNHDITFHPKTYAENWNFFHRHTGQYDTSITSSLLTHCIYLQDSSHILNGIKYYGSPWTPEFGYGWAFNKNRHEIYQKWDLIPSDTDVLITHGPPLGRGDLAHSGTRAGCVNLLQQVQSRVRPRIHLFGHIHEEYGVTSDGTTLYINASSCFLGYQPDNPCIVVDLPHDKDLPAVIVKPKCIFSGEEIISLLKSMCESQAAYCKLIPFFEGTKPLIQGKDLVADNVSLNEILSRLCMHRENNIIDLKRVLRDFVMDLRTLSY